MDTVTRNDLNSLTGDHTPPCVSIYLPTHIAGPEGQQDPVRLKNLLDEAEEQLSGQWMRAVDARKLLQPAREISTDPSYWDARSHGLAVFLSSDHFAKYRVPLEFKELAVVDRRFHVVPLLPAVDEHIRFYILALSQNHTRFFEASEYAIREVNVPNLPANMDDALNYIVVDRGEQVHSAMRPDQGRPGKETAVFHGQGGERDAHKYEIAAFFRLVDAAIEPVLKGETAPLVLAGVDYELAIFREVGIAKNIATDELTGNFDYATPHEIHEQAWPLIAPTFQRARQVAVAKHRQNVGKKRGGTDNIRHILAAAKEGRIESLFVDSRAQLWGVYNPQSAEAELHEARNLGDEDLLNLAAIETLSRAGMVYVVPRDQMPCVAPASAVFRY